jgi:glycosyltransferase involved in cell wall biosynthesis
VIKEQPLEVSIIIPLLDHADELLRCLRALDAQTYGRGRFEVVVVSNASETPLDSLIEQFSFARCIREPKPGSYAARNRGVEASRAEIIAFTDADCAPESTWIERGVRAIRHLAVLGSVAGKIELTFHHPTERTTAELFESVLGFRQKAYVEWGFGATANLFTTRATIARVGPFDERLMSGGDAEWGHRLRAQGLTLEYADDVRVFHAARRTFRQLFQKAARVGGGLQQIAEQEGRATVGLLGHAFRELLLLRTIRAHLSDNRLSSIGKKLRFAAVVWAVEFVRTGERYRVHYGGTPRRR